MNSYANYFNVYNKKIIYIIFVIAIILFIRISTYISKSKNNVLIRCQRALIENL